LNDLSNVFMHESGSDFVVYRFDFDIFVTKYIKQVLFFWDHCIFVQVLKTVTCSFNPKLLAHFMQGSRLANLYLINFTKAF
jgi:hypothetical protein